MRGSAGERNVTAAAHLGPGARRRVRPAPRGDRIIPDTWRAGWTAALSHGRRLITKITKATKITKKTIFVFVILVTFVTFVLNRGCVLSLEQPQQPETAVQRIRYSVVCVRTKIPSRVTAGLAKASSPRLFFATSS
jgi:hypothetical protein